MIVRVFNEDQYRLPDSALERMQELDRAVQQAVDANDDDRFHTCYTALLDYIRSEGETLADDELEPSDLMLPPADTTLEEARDEFTGEGLIPD